MVVHERACVHREGCAAAEVDGAGIRLYRGRITAAREVQAGEREHPAVRRLAGVVQVPRIRSRDNLYALLSRFERAEPVDLERPHARWNLDLPREPDDSVCRVELLERDAAAAIPADEKRIVDKRLNRVAQRDRRVAVDVERALRVFGRRDRENARIDLPARVQRVVGHIRRHRHRRLVVRPVQARSVVQPESREPVARARHARRVGKRHHLAGEGLLERHRLRAAVLLETEVKRYRNLEELLLRKARSVVDGARRAARKRSRRQNDDLPACALFAAVAAGGAVAGLRGGRGLAVVLVRLARTALCSLV